MPISSLFSGMEAYLDGDISCTDTVDDATIAEQTAEVASDTADASEEAKDTEVASQMLSRMCDMYDHVKQFGIDRTFVSLYNRHGELDRVCGIQFPSCESMDVVGDRYSRYSTAFIAAMEDEKEGLWAKFKKMVAKIWNWIKEKVSNIWKGIKKLFGFSKAAEDKLEKNIAGKSKEELAKIADKVPQPLTERVFSIAKVAAPIAIQLTTAAGMFFRMKKEAERSNALSDKDIEKYKNEMEKYKKEFEQAKSRWGKVKAGFGVANNWTAVVSSKGKKLVSYPTRWAYNTVTGWLGLRSISKNMRTLTDTAASVNDRISAAVSLLARNVNTVSGIADTKHSWNIHGKFAPFIMCLNWGKWLLTTTTWLSGTTTVAFLKWLNLGNKALNSK